MRLSQLYYEVTRQVMLAKPGDDPVVYIKERFRGDEIGHDFEQFYTDKEGDLIMEIY